ncbi:ubiquitin-like domain-containing ctd phosphatase [Quercus suber]|uniref:protein-serine/threonine phosphatase n=1 Tax=Quercus suber TaxID=58331 RepID=A0AAW0KM11_QUESU
MAASASASTATSSSVSEEELTLTVKWSGKEYTVRVCADDSVGELKRRICELTTVLPKRQKLLYPKLIASRLADDSVLLSQLPLKSSLKMTMIGNGKRESIELKNPCREGKKLLVLDIDYTLFDHRSTAENPLELMRPYLHEFLTAAYAEYDIMIWSATSIKWVELKMGQLGVLSNPNYKITALLDHLAMITVQSDSRGIFDCKPLGLIWAQFPEFYSSKNTIMFDDLRRNFVMNPQNGLIIKPFRKAHANRDNDQELVKLTQYLLAIAELDDLSTLNHNHWERFTEDNVKRPRHA